MSDEGTVYLLCFHRRSANGARHYIGWTGDLERRVEAHRKGKGSRLTRAIRNEGIGFDVVRVWTPATLADERRMKRRKQHGRLCPRCRGEALARHAAEEREGRKRRAAVMCPS